MVTSALDPDDDARTRGGLTPGALAIRALGAALGLDGLTPPSLGDDERRYLAGFLAGLGGGAAALVILLLLGCPTLVDRS